VRDLGLKSGTKQREDAGTISRLEAAEKTIRSFWESDRARLEAGAKKVQELTALLDSCQGHLKLISEQREFIDKCYLQKIEELQKART
jgi:hypothetical protein